MTTENLINYNIPILKPEDTIFQALDLLEEHKIEQLAVVDNKNYLGIVNEDLLLNFDDDNKPVSELSLLGINHLIEPNTHYIEALRILFKGFYSIIPVIDQDEFIGIVSYQSLLTEVSKLIAFEGKGAIIVLNVNLIDYSLAEISRLVESNGAKILMSYIQQGDKDDSLYVSLCLNDEDASNVIATLERFDYSIIAAFHKTDKEDFTKERLNQLLKYLDI